ncbi:MAG: ROK family protein [Chloroflexota bacterium]
MIKLGLDIGGTKTAALAGGPDNQPLGEATVTTDVSSPQAVIQSAVNAAALALQAAGCSPTDVVAAGAGVPGQVDRKTGTVRLGVNLNFHEPYPLAAALQEVLGVPVVLENDVRAAALGAYQWINTREPVDSLAYLSIGTGISAGIVIEGRLYRGVNGMAGEIGHIPVDPAGPRCACGALGCLETVASGPAIAAYANEILPEAQGGKQLTTFDVLTMAAEGNQGAIHVVERAGYFLSRAIYLLVMTYDVEKIVLGGGVTRAGAAFQRPLEKALNELRSDSTLAEMMLPQSKILVLPGDYNAGVRGTIMLADEAAVTAV